MAAILLGICVMNSKALAICALLFVSLSAVLAIGPMSYREIAMLLRNGEDPQFIINDTARRKLLQPLSGEEEQTLLSLHATPALMTLLRDPATLASPDAAAAYTRRVQEQKQQALREQQLAAQASANALLQQQQKERALAKPAGVASPSSGTDNEFAGKPLSLKFDAADGSPVDLAKLHGKVVLIDFWATWCGPCMKEVPNVVAAYAKYHDKGFEIIGISLDKSKDAMLRMTSQKGMIWPQYFDGKGWENEISSGFHVRSIPTMWLVNKNGVLAIPNARADLEGQIAKLLAE
jgi:thiol-disulfide isomerase/thioredoxin